MRLEPRRRLPCAQVTEVTVRNRYKELARELNIKIPIK